MAPIKSIINNVSQICDRRNSYFIESKVTSEDELKQNLSFHIH